MEWQAKFQTRVQQRGESLVEYAGELRVLAGRAFPMWSNEQREMLTRNQFIQGILSPSVQVQLMKDMPKSVSDAVATARRLEAVEATRPINGGKREGMPRNLWQLQLRMGRLVWKIGFTA